MEPTGQADPCCAHRISAQAMSVVPSENEAHSPASEHLSRQRRYWNDDIQPCISKYCIRKRETMNYIRCLQRYCVGRMMVSTRSLGSWEDQEKSASKSISEDPMLPGPHIANSNAAECLRKNCNGAPSFVKMLVCFWKNCDAQETVDEGKSGEGWLDDVMTKLSQSLKRIEQKEEFETNLKQSVGGDMQSRLMAILHADMKLPAKALEQKQLENKHTICPNGNLAVAAVLECMKSFCLHTTSPADNVRCVVQHCSC